MRTIFLLILLCSFFFVNAQNFDWVKPIQGKSWASGAGIRDVAVDDSNNIYLLGSYYQKVDVDPGPDSNMIYHPGGWNSQGMFVTKYDSTGDLIWVFNVGDTNGDVRPSKIRLGASNELYVTGSYVGTVDFDPGSGTAIGDSAGMSYLLNFVLGITSNGMFDWLAETRAVSFFGRAQNANIELDEHGDIYATGTFQYSLDFDPSIDSTIVSAGGVTSFYILKLSDSGEFIWVKSIDVSFPFNSPNPQIKFDDSGEFYFVTPYTGQVDFDPGTSQAFLNSPQPIWASHNLAICKFDTSGSFLWAKEMTGGTSYPLRGMDLDANHNLILCVSFEDTLDADPDTTTTSFLTAQNYGLAIVKISPSGSLIWGERIEADATAYYSFGFDIGLSDEITMSAYFQTMFDADPGPLYYPLLPQMGSNGVFLIQLDSVGQFNWARSMVGNASMYPSSISRTQDSAFLFVGNYTGSVDFDPGLDSHIIEDNTLSQIDGYLLRLTKGGCDLSFGIDSLKHVSCGNDSGFISIVPNGLTPPYSYEWSTNPIVTDSSISIGNSGLYSVTVTDANGCDLAISVPVSGPTSIALHDFNQNLGVTPGFLPGQASTITVKAWNEGCLAKEGTIKVIIDDSVSLDSLSIPADSINGTTYHWSFDSLFYDSNEFEVQIHVSADTQLTSFSWLSETVNVLPKVSDFDTLNNEGEYFHIASNSYDPNKLEAQPRGECPERYILGDEQIRYTIYFQNTGNSPAINIEIHDTLPPTLDLNSLKVIDYSHEPMIPFISHDNVLRFNFDDINLPDSTSNEPESHGYVTFEMMPQTGLPENTVIFNQASIFFDFNEPIITNETFHTVVSEIPNCQVGVAEIEAPAELSVYPNPTSSQLWISANFDYQRLEVFDVSGRRIASFGNERSIDISNIKSGIYILRAVGENQKQIARFVKN